MLGNNQREVSFSRSERISNLDFKEFLGLLDFVFATTEIKAVICSGTLIYVPPEKRDEIFAALHSSLIGGHHGVSKTYNRIRQKYAWENMKPDIQRRIQQCLNCQIKK